MAEFLGSFCEQLVQVLTRSSSCTTKLVKFVEDSSEFDISFPISLKIWQNQCDSVKAENIDEYQNNILNFATSSCENAEEFLILQSKEWAFPISKIAVVKSHCLISLRRVDVYEKCLRSIKDDFGKIKKSELDTVCVTVENDVDTKDDSLTQYRVNLISNVLKNLVDYSKYVQVEDFSIAQHKIIVTSRSNPKKDENTRNNSIIICCGPVINTNNNKISNESTHQFIQQRMNDMHLIAVHKYGMRLKDNNALDSLVARLGESAAKLDLLEVKHTSAIKLTSDPKKAFVLYNSARIETLLEKFDEQEKCGYYEKLPSIEEIDVKLLVEDDEWRLMKLILTFPETVDRAICGLADGKVSIISIHKYLICLVNIFSVYYRRVRLLTSNQKQLIPSLHAKIHFVRLVRMILNKTLAIFDIQPVAFM